MCLVPSLGSLACIDVADKVTENWKIPSVNSSISLFKKNLLKTNQLRWGTPLPGPPRTPEVGFADLSLSIVHPFIEQHWELWGYVWLAASLKNSWCEKGKERKKKRPGSAVQTGKWHQHGGATTDFCFTGDFWLSFWRGFRCGFSNELFEVDTRLCNFFFLQEKIRGKIKMIHTLNPFHNRSLFPHRGVYREGRGYWSEHPWSSYT